MLSRNLINKERAARVQLNGRAEAFQAYDAGSIPFAHSNLSDDLSGCGILSGTRSI